MFRVLVTGGAGFVGANLALALARAHEDWEVVALDNLYRRGSELNLERLKAGGVRFVHGDVRSLADLLAVGEVGAIVECSAEPSVLAGTGGEAPDYLVQTNLVGAYHCLELARRTGAQIVFLSTSRVYPVAPLQALTLEETETRFTIAAEQAVAGASPAGISEAFPLDGARTLYGTTKLSAELMIAEYAESYDVPAVIDRFGVIAGPWQMGKVDQGVFTYWMLAHVLDRPLSYIGFGGTGKQVRDLIHVEDAVALVDRQLADPGAWSGVTVNVGGGVDSSLSLRETTALCAEITGRTLEVGAETAQRPGDLPVYISDTARLDRLTDWRPQRSARDILSDVFEWIVSHETVIRRTL